MVVVVTQQDVTSLTLLPRTSSWEGGGGRGHVAPEVSPGRVVALRGTWHLSGPLGIVVVARRGMWATSVGDTQGTQGCPQRGASDVSPSRVMGTRGIHSAPLT